MSFSRARPDSALACHDQRGEMAELLSSRTGDRASWIKRNRQDIESAQAAGHAAGIHR